MGGAEVVSVLPIRNPSVLKKGSQRARLPLALCEIQREDVL